MFDELDKLLRIGRAIRAQPQNVSETPSTSAALANVVDDQVTVVRVNNKGQQRFSLRNQLFVQRILRTGNNQLLDEYGQSLSERNIGSFCVLMLVVMKQFDNERDFLESVPQRARLFRSCLAPLNTLVKSRQSLPFLRNLAGCRILLKKRFKIIFEIQNYLFGLGTRI